MRIFVLLFLILFCSCSSGVKLTFKNGSSETYKKVHAELGKNKYDFDNLKSGETTKTIKVDGAFSYCPIKIITQKDTLVFFPIDYVGEKFYKSGKLQMVIEIKEFQNKRIIDINAKR